MDVDRWYQNISKGWANDSHMILTSKPPHLKKKMGLAIL